MIRLIAMDLDGTLLNNRSRITENTAGTLREAMRLGARVVLASGRMLETVAPFARQIGANAPLIVFNGAMVYDLQEDRVLFADAIPKSTARAICREAEKIGAFIQYYPGRGLFYARRDPERCDEYEGRVRLRGREVGVPLSAFIEQDAMKLLALGPWEPAGALEEAIGQIPGVYCAYSRPTYLEIVKQGVNKGRALRMVAGQLGVAREEILAFGDAANDLDMLAYAGTGYAMANAPAEILRQVPLHAPENDLDGVAQVIAREMELGRIGG